MVSTRMKALNYIDVPLNANSEKKILNVVSTKMKALDYGCVLNCLSEGEGS